MTAERETVVDFSAPYFDYAGLQILMKRPDTTVPLFMFTLIFSEYAWATWFSILILTGLLIFFFHRWLNRTFAKKVVPKPINLFNLSDSFWFVTASIALAGSVLHNYTTLLILIHFIHHFHLPSIFVFVNNLFFSKMFCRVFLLQMFRLTFLYICV